MINKAQASQQINNINSLEQNYGACPKVHYDSIENGNFESEYEKMKNNNNNQSKTNEENVILSKKINDGKPPQIFNIFKTLHPKTKNKKKNKEIKDTKYGKYNNNINNKNIKESKDKDISDELSSVSSLINNKQEKKQQILIDLKEDENKETNNNTFLNSNISEKDLFHIPILYKTELENIIKIKNILYNCLTNLIIFIDNRAKTKIQYKFELKYICIDNLHKIDLDNYEDILKENLFNLFLGKFSNLNPEEKEGAKNEMILLLNFKNDNNKHIDELLNIIFFTKIEEIFKIYVNDERYVKNFLLKEFQTLKNDCKGYNEEEILKIKKYVNILLNIELPNLEESSKDDNRIIDINYSNKRKDIIRKAIKSIFAILKDYVLIKYKEQLYTPTIDNKLGNSVKEHAKLFNKKLKYIFSRLIPKNNKPDKDYSKRIDEVLKIEKKEEEKENRKLDKLLNYVQIFNIMRAFINDENIIKNKKNNIEVEFYLINFKTFKDCFNDLNKEEKEAIKNDFIKLLAGDIVSRKKSKQRNLKLKKNKKLTGRKRIRSK